MAGTDALLHLQRHFGKGRGSKGTCFGGGLLARGHERRVDLFSLDSSKSTEQQKSINALATACTRDAHSGGSTVALTPSALRSCAGATFRIARGRAQVFIFLLPLVNVGWCTP